ncbi:MAG: hypothetical protein GY799_02030 [Desulfobulbaceae bacterium]|nr:hypothetical protein [Desulfobulbaceae bacterium]
MNTAFEDIVKSRIAAIEKVTGEYPNVICMTEVEFDMLEREMVRNRNYVKEPPLKYSDGRHVEMTNCYDGVEIKIWQE